MSTTRPHLLYVAWGYPPSRGAGVYRALATPNAFARAGWDVTVLTADRAVFETQLGADPELEKSIDPRIDVQRLPFSWVRGEPDLSRWSRFRVASNLLWSWLRSKADRISFPEAAYGGWRWSLQRGAAEIHARKPVDLTIATANPNVDFIAGWHLHRKHGVPYVMDYRDTWTLDVYRDERTAARRSRTGRLEARLISRAQEIWFVNQAIRDWHAKEYPQDASRMHVVRNGYDEATTLTLGGDRAARQTNEGLTFGYLGTMYGPMPLRELFEAWRLARSRNDLIARSRMVFHGHLGHYAVPDPALVALFAEYADDGVVYAGPVSRTNVGKAYADFDVLLLVLGKSKYVTSGKVYEYAATGLPIVSVHDSETAASEILDGSPVWVQPADLGSESLATALQDAAAMASSATPESRRAVQEWARQHERTRQLTPRVQHLTEMVAPGARTAEDGR